MNLRWADLKPSNNLSFLGLIEVQKIFLAQGEYIKETFPFNPCNTTGRSNSCVKDPFSLSRSII